MSLGNAGKAIDTDFAASRTVTPVHQVDGVRVELRSVVPVRHGDTDNTLAGTINLSKVFTQTSGMAWDQSPGNADNGALPLGIPDVAQSGHLDGEYLPRRSSNAIPTGTNGCGSKVRVRFKSLLLTYSVEFVPEGPKHNLHGKAAKVVFTSAPLRKCSTSISLMTTCLRREGVRLPPQVVLINRSVAGHHIHGFSETA